MKKLSLLPALLLIGGIAAQAQVRNLVPIVRPVLHESTKAFILKLGESMAKDGYSDAAEYLKAWAEGGFGSGFVYLDPRDGRNFVVTNRHVVAQAELVTLEFEKEDGSTTSYKSCPILAVSETLDLALIGFPNGANPFSAGISLSSSLPVDGLDIWSAGFPGLLSRPSWQFGKGSVTNNRARVPELADPADTELIQHSAPIDPGSSGGPLLAALKSAASGYEVIGINTWKVGGRQDTNFAIPSAAIRSFIQQALSPTETSPGDKLAERSQAFVAAAAAPEDAYKKLARFISYEFVANEGERLLKSALASAPTKIRNDIVERFIGSSPVEGLRYAIAYAIAETAELGPAIGLGPREGIVQNDGEGTVGLTRGDSALSTRWILEHGHWRLASFQPVESKAAAAAAQEKKDREAGGFDFVSPYDFAFTGGALFELGGDALIAGNLGMALDIFSSYFVLMHFEMGFGKSRYYDSWDMEEKSAAFIMPRVGLTAQLPLQFGELYVVPYGKFSVGFNMSLSLDSDSSGFLSSLGGGLYLTPPGSSWSFGAEYAQISIAEPFDGNTKKMNAISAFVAYGFY